MYEAGEKFNLSHLILQITKKIKEIQFENEKRGKSFDFKLNTILRCCY